MSLTALTLQLFVSKFEYKFFSECEIMQLCESHLVDVSVSVDQVTLAIYQPKV